MILEDCHMSSIAEKTYAEQSSVESVSNFYEKYELGTALKRADAYKQKGIAASTVIQYLIALIYTGKSMFEDMRSAVPFAQGFGKDTVYRFMNMMKVNWQTFLLAVAAKAVSMMDGLTSSDRRSAYVIDDTVHAVPYAKNAELVSKIHDHAEKGKNKYKWGFKMLTLGWTDGASFIPLAFRHLASANEALQRCKARAGIDKRSRAHKIRKEAVSKATDVLLVQLKAAIRVGYPPATSCSTRGSPIRRR